MPEYIVTVDRDDAIQHLGRVDAVTVLEELPFDTVLVRMPSNRVSRVASLDGVGRVELNGDGYTLDGGHVA